MIVTHLASYRIKHLTKYEYSHPVAICQNQLRMMPRSRAQMLSQIDCHRVTTKIVPDPDVISEHTDYFGNNVFSFSIESTHRQLLVSVQSDVTVRSQPWPGEEHALAWKEVIAQIHSGADPLWCMAQDFCFDSPRIRRSKMFRDYALVSFVHDRDIGEAAMELTQRIHDDFAYDTEATDVNTRTEQAFEIRAGVCQDFAHIQVACLRSIGLPARYVSGYLRTVPPPGQVPMVGADESHAWVSLYMGQQLGWVDLDPTNACRCDANHIPVCIGRDYSEVSPMRGVVLGGGETGLHVSVDVRATSG